MLATKFLNSFKIKNFYETLCGNLLVFCYFLCRNLPINLCSNFGGIVLGKILSIRSRKANQKLRNNIHILCPHITSSYERKKIQRAVWENRGRLLAEYPKLHHIWKSDCAQIIGKENLVTAQAYDRPIIFLFLHLGNWTVIGYKLGILLGKRVIHPFNSQKNIYRRRILENIRQSYSKHFIEKGAISGKEIINKLQKGYAFFVGVDAFSNGKTMIPSFGRDLLHRNNLTDAVRLAKLSNAILCPVYALRKEKTSDFSIHVLSPLALDFTNFDNNEFRKTIISLDQLMESIVSKHIEQWFYITSLDLDSTVKK